MLRGKPRLQFPGSIQQGLNIVVVPVVDTFNGPVEFLCSPQRIRVDILSAAQLVPQLREDFLNRSFLHASPLRQRGSALI